MTTTSETVSSSPDRFMQERAASVGGNAAISMVVETLGGMDAIGNKSIGDIMRQNLVAFRTELGRPIKPDSVAEIPRFVGLDEQDSTNVIPKLQSAFLLYTTAYGKVGRPKSSRSTQTRHMATYNPRNFMKWA